ncbi:hypothetical protein P879_03642 [Paragonimus westermani]|uniref:Folliculin n=1 Tax=Paragonimus westermani TaxID=34504 RepID=A0A8T0DXL3_9TREM|nr:hypothetical protein P879_03642 [Paragonimus westermani]
MNAILALCHFCEQHGPSIVMCTQPYRQNPCKGAAIGTEPQTTNSGTTTDSVSINRTSSHVGLYNFSGNGDVGPSDGAFGPVTFQSDTASTQVTTKMSPAASQQLNFPNISTCRACSFTVRDEPGFVSHDRTANTSYISTQWPKDPDLFNFVWTACQRSLSCEVCPGSEGASYFGDEVYGHVVNYNFHVKDSQARGFQSRFSFLVVCWDRVYLLNLWPFLVSNLSKMASRIMQAAERVYTTKVAAWNAVSTGTGPSQSNPRPVSTIPIGRLATPPPHPPPAFCGQAIAAAGSTTGKGISVTGVPVARHRRAGEADMRSLADLTKDDQIFCRMHAWFTWLLRAGSRRWTVLPSLTAPPDEDSLIEQEERLACVAGLTSTDHLGSGLTVVNLGTTCSKRSALPASAGQCQSDNIPLTGGSQLVTPLGNVGTSTMMIGNSLGLSDGSLESETEIALLVLTRLLSSLGVEAFKGLAQHVAIGNQLVVQPLKSNLHGCLVVAAVAKLLPKGCLKQIVCSSEYLPPFRCNLLSLTVDAAPMEPADRVLFLMVYPQPWDAPSGVTATVEDFVKSLQFRLFPTLPPVDSDLATLKTIVQQGGEIPPTSDASSPAVPSECGAFVNRVVQLLSLQPPLPTSTLDLALSSARQEWINRARLLYSFKRCQGPTLSSEETTRWAEVSAVIDCTEPENSNVVRFWQGALSQYSRQNTCHARRRPTTSATNSRKGSCCSSMVDLATAMTTASLMD